MLTTQALTTLKKCIVDNLDYAQYKVNSAYTKTPITSVEVTSAGNVEVRIQINPTSTGTVTISEVQLYDHSGRLWDSKVENIQIKASQEGVLYLFTYTVTAS